MATFFVPEVTPPARHKATLPGTQATKAAAAAASGPRQGGRGSLRYGTRAMGCYGLMEEFAMT